MAWESRGNRQYFYRKKWANGTVKSEYIGTGLVADYVAQTTKTDKLIAEHRRLEFEEMRQQHAEIDSVVDDIGDKLKAFVEATLLVSGYHTYKRQWRKRGNNHHS